MDTPQVETTTQASEPRGGLRVATVVVVAALLLGVGLRTVGLGRASLWSDEAYLGGALSAPPGEPYVMDFGGGRQLVGLRNMPVPLLWAYLNRAAVRAFGRTVLDYRVIPWLFSVATLWLIFRFTARLCGRETAWVAVVLLALNPLAIAYARHLKHYSAEPFFALAIALTALDAAWVGGARRWLLYGLVALLALGFSYTAVFVIAASALLFFVPPPPEENAGARPARGRQALWWVGVHLLLGGCFLVYYVLVMAPQSHAWPRLADAWAGAGGFPPARSPGAVLAWATGTVPGVLFELDGRVGWELVLVLVGWGVAALAPAARRVLLMYLLVILAVLLAAAILGKYPLAYRLGTARVALFLGPVLLAGMAAGVWAAYRYWWPRMPVALAALGVVFVPTLRDAALTPASAPPREDARAMVRCVQAHWRPGDRGYVHYGVEHPVRYYWRGPTDALTFGHNHREQPAEYLREIEALGLTGRLWFLYGHELAKYQMPQRQFILDFLARHGRLVHECQAQGAWAYCFEFPEGS